MSKHWCIDNLKVLKNNAGQVDAKVFEETIKYLEEDIFSERIEQMVAELYKEADLMIDREGEDCMAVLIDDAIDIIHKYTKEQTE